MRGIRKTKLCLAVMLGLALPECAAAVELTGALATDSDQCDKVFVRHGRAKQLDFVEFPGVHGGGFIIDADQLRGKFAKCKIKTRKEDGQNLNLIAACASDIMLSNVQFVLKVVDDNTITRLFPGMDGMEVNYHRCRP